MLQSPIFYQTASSDIRIEDSILPMRAAMADLTTHRPPQTPTLTPYLTVQDAAKTIAFYETAFGFSLMFKHEEAGRPVHVQMAYQGEQVVMFAPEGAFGSTAKAPTSSGVEMPFNFYVYVPDVDPIYRRAVAAGCKSIMPPDNMFWGERFCQVEDLDGYRWGFGCVLAGNEPA
jgi:uncharacterized glyoxalase superfamily protein PhnB